MTPSHRKSFAMKQLVFIIHRIQNLALLQHLKEWNTQTRLEAIHRAGTANPSPTLGPSPARLTGGGALGQHQPQEKVESEPSLLEELSQAKHRIHELEQALEANGPGEQHVAAEGAFTPHRRSFDREDSRLVEEMSRFRMDTNNVDAFATARHQAMKKLGLLDTPHVVTEPSPNEWICALRTGSGCPEKESRLISISRDPIVVGSTPPHTTTTTMACFDRGVASKEAGVRDSLQRELPAKATALELEIQGVQETDQPDPIP